MLSIDVVLPTHNNPDELLRAIKSVKSQKIDIEADLNVIVYDDGSSPANQEKIRDEIKHETLILCKSNSGRSHAKNQGAAAGTGEIIVFLDSDCVYSSESDLNELINKIRSGADLAIGIVKAQGTDFWARYQNEISSRRLRSGIQGDYTGMSLASFATKRRTFEDIGGFDEKYRNYGFEDRDLIVRGLKFGAKVDFSPNHKALHKSDITLEDVVEKVYESAVYTAPRFSEEHPGEYQKLPYKWVEKHSRLILAITGFGFLNRKRAGRIGNLIIEAKTPPYRMKKYTTKIVTAIAFLEGTRERNKNKQSRKTGSERNWS